MNRWRAQRGQSRGCPKVLQKARCDIEFWPLLGVHSSHSCRRSAEAWAMAGCRARGPAFCTQFLDLTVLRRPVVVFFDPSEARRELWPERGRSAQPGFTLARARPHRVSVQTPRGHATARCLGASSQCDVQRPSRQHKTRRHNVAQLEEVSAHEASRCIMTQDDSRHQHHEGHVAACTRSAARVLVLDLLLAFRANRLTQGLFLVPVEVWVSSPQEHRGPQCSSGHF